MSGQVRPENVARNAEIVRMRRAKWAPVEIAVRLRLTKNQVIGVLYRAGMTDPNDDHHACGRGREYSEAYRQAAVAATRYRTRADVAEEYGIAGITLSNWIRLHKAWKRPRAA